MHIGKSDPSLGRQVEAFLKEKGLNTPTIDISHFTEDQRVRLIQASMEDILKTIGMDLTDDSLQDTPLRIAKMYVHELFWGLNPDNFPKCTTVANKMNYNKSFVLEKNITVHSFCEHHFVAIDGFASVAYIPRNEVLGLSKLNRITQYFAKRPQVQERLTEQIAETLSFIAKTPDVAVHINASHFCVKTRGIQDVSSTTETFASRGVFADLNSPLRREFLSLLSH